MVCRAIVAATYVDIESFECATFWPEATTDFFRARLSDTLNTKRNSFYLHTVPGKLLALTLY